MSAQAEAILEQALRLTADERANLASALQRSLDEGGHSSLPPEEVARLWNEEIERRLERARARIARGEPAGRTADEVYADAEARVEAIRASRDRG
ncbi:MAG TPA: addiction module protein [Kofleriaceae bacterium]|jgi:DNA-directed RNA polymerase specialized sigma54-like protein